MKRHAGEEKGEVPRKSVIYMDVNSQLEQERAEHRSPLLKTIVTNNFKQDCISRDMLKYDDCVTRSKDMFAQVNWAVCRCTSYNGKN